MEIREIHPVLATPDVETLLVFYSKLGFTLTFRDDANAPRYAVVRSGSVELHLQWADPPSFEIPGDRPVYRFLVDDVDACFAAAVQSGAVTARANGGTPYARPRDTTWGTREFHLRDPGRNGLQFYAPLDATP